MVWVTSGRQASLHCLQGTLVPCLPGSPGMPLSPWKQSKKHREREQETQDESSQGSVRSAQGTGRLLGEMGHNPFSPLDSHQADCPSQGHFPSAVPLKPVVYSRTDSAGVPQQQCWEQRQFLYPAITSHAMVFCRVQRVVQSAVTIG